MRFKFRFRRLFPTLFLPSIYLPADTKMMSAGHKTGDCEVSCPGRRAIADVGLCCTDGVKFSQTFTQLVQWIGCETESLGPKKLTTSRNFGI